MSIKSAPKHKVFTSVIEKYSFMPTTMLYDEFHKNRMEQVKEEVKENGSSLYFLTKVPKLSFNGSFETKRKYKNKKIDKLTLHCTIENMKTGKLHKIQFDLFKILSDKNKNILKKSFNSKKTRIEIYNKDTFILFNDLKTPEILLTMNIYHLLNFINKELVNPEVLYIGKSNKDIWKRVYGHNKWGLITHDTDCKTEELIAYYFVLKHKDISVYPNIGKVHPSQRQNINNISKKDLTTITEGCLINHFVSTTRYNVDMVKKDITKWKKVQEELVNNGYTHINVKIDAIGGMCNFWSNSKQTNVGSDEHTAIFDLINQKKRK